MVFVSVPNQSAPEAASKTMWRTAPPPLSGAGPSILVLGSDPAQRLEAARLVAESADTPWQALMLAVDFKGAVVAELPDANGRLQHP